jgi:hypothetical protein
MSGLNNNYYSKLADELIKLVQMPGNHNNRFAGLYMGCLYTAFICFFLCMIEC